jgi:hypothetical protein
MALRKSDGFLLFIGGGMLLLAAILIQAHVVMRADLPGLRQKAEVVKSLGLTDLCLTTEARYTRHPSQADWHAAFQTHPLALDHFPSGSIIGPPETLTKPHAQIH